ncbi:hypothetical protein BS47DRAFT_1311043 [Hydnum rufescens UP504]|uniref:DNA-binding TFAR19-related protein n=1 Tax=Hydnum rufescens UP504 TaxID=1448309 RepID=A0A9P6BBM5_9AGAM|nr:hypothetical protein BS47DRAFT_1311043 [Hydnum rufescens UP504]
METNEFAAIRAASQGSARSAGEDGIQGSGDDGSKRRQEEETRRDILATVLDTDARERLSRIALVNPTLSSQIEGILLRMAQSGQLRGRVTEQQLIGLLDQAEQATGKSGPAKKSTIVYQRRRDIDDDWDV